MKQTVRVVTRPLQAKFIVPGSKSITNRALLLAALSEGESVLANVLLSEDTHALIVALQQLGVDVWLDEVARTCRVIGCGGRFPNQKTTIWCHNAGTVARFLLAACAATSGEFLFDATAQLRARPLAGLLQVLTRLGAKVVPNDAKQMPFVLHGADELQGGEVMVDGSETGQFVSAVLMVAPFAKTAMTIDVHHLVSKPFVEMTCVMMREFGVMVHRMHQTRFAVPVPQRYVGQQYVIEPDLSTASYFFAAAAITNGSVAIQSFDLKKSKQGDAKFLDVLIKMGCHVHEDAAGLTVQGAKELRGVSVDMSDFSDTFMTLAAIAPFATTPTTITNIGHTRLQESNRITVMRENLEKLNVRAEEGHDWLRIHPSQPRGGIVDPHHDHRIAMAFAVLGLKVAGVEIQDAECVAKTCPEFFELLEEIY